MPILSSCYLVQSIDLDQPIQWLPEATWEEAHLLSDFCYPWNEGTPPATHFRALHSSDTIYFRFDIEDDDLCAEVIENEQMEVTESDRVELFFCQDEHLDPYFCLEMDYLGRLLSNSASYHRKMNYDWNWPESFYFKSQETTTGFSVEGRIQKSSLKNLGLLKKDELQVGIFRGQYSTKEDQPVRWISWIDPQTPKPDFHVPSAFGILKLL
jgi:hypothetical protein